MNECELSLDLLLQETLALTEYLRGANASRIYSETIQNSFFDTLGRDDDYLYDLADSLVSEIKEEPEFLPQLVETELLTRERVLPETTGVIYKIDNGSSTF